MQEVDLIVKQREKGINRYEIYAILQLVLKEHARKTSTTYKISRWHGKERLSKKCSRTNTGLPSRRQESWGIRLPSSKPGHDYGRHHALLYRLHA
jgi:hypothetical protein